MSTEFKPLSIVTPGEPLWPKSFGLPTNHCLDVARGSYDCPYYPEKPPVVIDLGANCGMFTRWAAKRWPGAQIHAYEPNLENFERLAKTIVGGIVAQDDTLGSAKPYRVAVAGHAEKGVSLFAGKYNCGEHSLVMDAGQGSVPVDVISALDLPRADVLKCDTEGSEAAICATLHAAGRMSEFSAVLLELHNPAWVEPFCVRMAEAGFSLTGHSTPYPNRDELKFVKSDLIPADFKLPTQP